MAHRRSAPNRPLTPDAANTHALPFSDSDGESARLSGLAASFRIVSESLMRMEQTELEMTKAREALRLKAEKRRMESEAELTEMLLQTQVQIASLVSRGSDHHRRHHHHQQPSRKRKRAEDEGDAEENDSSSTDVSKREGALPLSLLQCSMLL